jgi:uncharacterized protein with GYD domain
MATYVMLMKLTEQGRKTIKESPARATQAIELAKKMGAKVHGLWYTQGEYDAISIADWPSDEAMATFALAAGSAGNFTSQTLRGFSVEEMTAIIKKMP